MDMANTGHTGICRRWWNTQDEEHVAGVTFMYLCSDVSLAGWCHEQCTECRCTDAVLGPCFSTALLAR